MLVTLTKLFLPQSSQLLAYSAHYLALFELFRATIPYSYTNELFDFISIRINSYTNYTLSE